jgi:predicted HAD superfamily phosphohydrolase YqeG
MKTVRELGEVDREQLRAKTVFLPKRHSHFDKKTVIFDLDETLIHCNRDSKESDVLLPITLPTG